MNANSLNSNHAVALADVRNMKIFFFELKKMIAEGETEFKPALEIVRKEIRLALYDAKLFRKITRDEKFAADYRNQVKQLLDSRNF
jgi:hypothetical protein